MKKTLKALVIYHGEPIKNPREKLVGGLPIASCDQIDIMTLEEHKTERYDIIAVFMCLQCLEPKKVPDALQIMHNMLNIRGELYVVAPSFDWAAEQAFTEEPHPMVHMMICGTEAVPHRTVMTLQWLRRLMEFLGFVVRVATPEQYKVAIDDKTNINLVRNLVVGWKLEERNAADAINLPDDNPVVLA